MVGRREQALAACVAGVIRLGTSRFASPLPQHNDVRARRVQGVLLNGSKTKRSWRPAKKFALL